MPELTLKLWERDFRRNADADGLAIVREHLRVFNLPGKPGLLLNR